MLIQTNDHQQVKIDFEMFTPDEYSDIHLFLDTQLHRFETKINRDVWDPRLYENTQGHTEVTLIEDVYFVEMIISRVIEKFDTTTDLSRYSVLSYKTHGQYNINWHDDAKFIGAVSIYLNENWNRTLGGHFIYQMDDQKVMTSVQPKQGTAVYIQGGVLHGTVPVSPIAPSRKSLQVFIL